MEERKKRFDDKTEVRGKLAEVLKKLAGGAAFFDGVHIFTPHADVPDDSALRLVVLPPEQFYAREETRLAFEAVLDYVRNNGPKPRYRGNRLLFLAPDHGALARLRDCVRVALAWGSIVEDIEGGAPEHRPAPEAAGGERTADRRGGAAASGPRVLQVAALPGAALGHRPEADGRGLPAEHQRLGARQRDRARVRGERAGDHDLVAHPPAQPS